MQMATISSPVDSHYEYQNTGCKDTFHNQGLLQKVRECMQFFRKRVKIGKKKKLKKGINRAKYLKIWTKMYKIRKYLEKG